MSRLWRRGLPGPTGRGPPWACRSVSGRVAGSRPGGRPHFLCGQEMGERSRRGLGRPARAAPGARYARRPLAGAPPRDPGLSPLRGPGPVGRILYKDGLRPNPLRPQRRLRLACGQSRRRPTTDERTSRQHPARRRAAGAMPLPASLRNRIGSSHRGGTSAFAWRAAPAGRRKTARLRRARAQGARTPGTGVVFRRAVLPSLPAAVVGRTESAISKEAVQSDGLFFMRVDGKTASAPPRCRTGGAGGGAPRPACIKSFGGPGGTLQSSPW